MQLFTASDIVRDGLPRRCGAEVHRHCRAAAAAAITLRAVSATGDALELSALAAKASALAALDADGLSGEGWSNPGSDDARAEAIQRAARAILGHPIPGHRSMTGFAWDAALRDASRILAHASKAAEAEEASAMEKMSHADAFFVWPLHAAAIAASKAATKNCVAEIL